MSRPYLAGRGEEPAVMTLAWRNVWRRKGRSMAVAAAVGIVVWLTLLYFGLVGAMGTGFYGQVTGQTGHIQVHVAGWREVRDLQSLLIPDASAVAGRIREGLPQARVDPVLEVPALLSGESRSRGVVLVGQTPPSWLQPRLREGRWYADDEPDAIVVGAALARALGVRAGEWVYAYAPGTLGLGAGAFRVVGLVGLPEPALEARAAYLPLAALQEMAAPGAATRLQVDAGIDRLADDPRVGAMRDALVRALGTAAGERRGVDEPAPGAGPALVAETWRELNPAAASLVEMLRPMTAVVTALFFVMAGLLVLNNVYLSLVERIREFGTILALGASRARVLAMVVLESALLTATGGSIGLALGLASVAALSGGFVYPYYDLERWGLPTVLYPSLQPSDVIVTVAFMLGTALAAALWPGFIASRVEPVEAMRFRG